MAGATDDQHPKRWKWRLEWLAQTGLEKLAGAMPPALAFRCGEALGGIAWHFMKSRRQIVLRNLRIAFAGDFDLPELEKMARENFRRTGANLFSALRTTRLTAAGVDALVDLENVEMADEELTRGPGLVLIPIHMGNWEILTRIHRLLPAGHANGAFYRPLNNPLLDRRVLANREALGCRLFSKRDSFHQASAFLREGGILGILADQRVGRQGEIVSFFGRLTRASPLPSLLARRSKVGALVLRLATVSPGKWRVAFLRPDPPIRTESCMAAIERAIRASPSDYFWMQERWRVYIHPNHTIRDWLGEGKSGEKPHRALLWLPGAPAGWELPADWIHADVIYEIVRTGPVPPRDPHNLYGRETRFHAGPDFGTREALVAFLESLDRSAALPIDFILACQAPKALAKAARRLSIPLVSLPPP